MRKLVAHILRNLPYVGKIISERDQLSLAIEREQSKNTDLVAEIDVMTAEQESLKGEYARLVPPGHFYSPIPSLSEVKKYEDRIFGRTPRSIEGIDLREGEQIRLFEQFRTYYEEMPYSPIDALFNEMEAFKSRYLEATGKIEREAIKQDAIEKYDALIRENKTGSLRYLFENPGYGYTDGIILYSMIRHINPKRVIEVGSGYSTCLLLDTNDIFFNGSINCTCIEPYPEFMLSLIKETDRNRIRLIEAKLQDVDLKVFSALEAGDILFIDSSHICKVNSDVNYILFEIFPHLKNGVYIHFHDIFYPFEYPKEWIFEGRAWNESYFLRAFLSYNNSFRIIFFTSFLQCFHKNRLGSEMPLLMRDKGGSIWIQKQSIGV